MNKTKTVTETNETNDIALPTGLYIAGAQVFRQLNGNTMYAVFSGTEEQITDAYNTLYNANAFSGELEFLTSALAFTTATPKAFQRGLLNRQEIRLIVDTPAPKCNCANWISKTAKANSENDWANMRDIRAVMPIEALIPEAYAEREMPASVEWHNERPDATAE